MKAPGQRWLSSAHSVAPEPMLTATPSHPSFPAPQASASLGRQLDSYAPRIFEAAIRVSRAHAAVRAAAAAGQPAPFEYDRYALGCWWMYYTVHLSLAG